MMSTFEQETLWIAAKAMSNDKSVKEVLRRLKERAVDDWASSPPEADAKRLDAYHMVRAISAFESELSALAAEPDVVRFNRRLRKA
jgi:hypothetical protein